MKTWSQQRPMKQKFWAKSQRFSNNFMKKQEIKEWKIKKVWIKWSTIFEFNLKINKLYTSSLKRNTMNSLMNLMKREELSFKKSEKEQLEKNDLLRTILLFFIKI